jgi:glutaredoxin 2
MMKLYIYEHCPFCVRPRLIANVKSLPIPLQVLANDDEQTHFDLIGQKIVPILEKDDGPRMTESLDICHFIDQYDKNPIIKPSANNPIINQIMEDLSNEAKYLTHTRQIFHPMNEVDFPTQSAKDYFRAKKEASLGMSFERAIQDSAFYAKSIQLLLDQLDQHLTYKFMTNEYFSMDDILFFPILRGLTIALDAITLPKNVSAYLKRIYGITDIKPYPHFMYQV